MNKKIFILVLLFLFIFSSCSTEKRDWEKVKSTYLLLSVLNFIEKYPEGKFVDEAISRVWEIYQYEKSSDKYDKSKVINNFLSELEIFINQNLLHKNIDKVRFILEKCHFDRVESPEGFKKAEGFVGFETDYMDFIKRFPNSPFVDEATKRIEDIYFKSVQKANSILSYTDYLDLYPQGAYKNNAESRLEELKRNRPQTLRDVKTIRIITKVTFPNNLQKQELLEDVLSLLENKALIWIRHAGYTVIQGDGEKNDATFRMEAKVQALKSSYGEPFYYYTGASTSGAFSFEIPGIYNFKKTFNGIIEPPSKLLIERNKVHKYRHPRVVLDPDCGSILFDVLNKSGSFYPTFYNLMNEIFGLEFNESYLRDPEGIKYRIDEFFKEIKSDIRGM